MKCNERAFDEQGSWLNVPFPDFLAATHTRHMLLTKEHVKRTTRPLPQETDRSAARPGSLCRLPAAQNREDWAQGELPDSGTDRFGLVLTRDKEAGVEFLNIAPLHFEKGFVLEGELWITPDENTAKIGTAVEVWNSASVALSDVKSVIGEVAPKIFTEIMALWQWTDTGTLSEGTKKCRTGRPIATSFEVEFRDQEDGKLSDLSEKLYEAVEDAHEAKPNTDLQSTSDLRIQRRSPHRPA